MSDTAAVLTVAQLNQCADGLLRDGLGSVRVEGEVSNLRRYPSGHQYFSLKDENASVNCVLFRGNARRAAPFADGDAVQVGGRAGIYPARGQFQIVVERLEPAGEGRLLAAFQRLKKQLEAEGLFDPARKRPLPAWTHRLGVITSAQGDVRHDIERTLARRFPLLLPVTLYPTAVQGAAAADQIVAALERAGAEQAVDVLLLARGGGSLEDLQAFNEENVARAIAACPIPVVTGVGHESDVTIADFVADLRASTPTAAAEAVSPDGPALRQQLGEIRARLEQRLERRITTDRARLEALATRLQRRHPRQLLERHDQRLDEQRERLQRAWRLNHERAEQRVHRARLRLAGASPGARLQQARLRLEHLHNRLQHQRPDRDLAARREHLRRLQARLEGTTRRQLDAQRRQFEASRRQLRSLDPTAVLQRGYAILATEAGELLRDAAAVSTGSAVHARLSRGSLELAVTGTHPQGTDAGAESDRKAAPGTASNRPASRSDGDPS